MEPQSADGTPSQPMGPPVSPCDILLQVLLQWLNDSLEGRRIVIRDIVEDVYDGQILGELLCEWPDWEEV